MRPSILRFAAGLALGGILLLASPVPRSSWADDAAEAAPDGTSHRAEALKSQVAELRRILAELEARLVELEKAMDREEKGAPPRKKPKPKPKPDAPESEEGEGEETSAEKPKPEEGEPDDEAETPAAEEPGEDEPGIDPAILEVAGTYALDTEAFAEAMEAALRAELESQGDDIPPEFVEGVLEGLRDQLAKATFELVLSVDLTFTAEMTMADETETVSGTWERDGDTVTLHQTHENGEEAEDPTDLVGTWNDGELRLKPEDQEEMPVEIVLRKVD